MRRNKANEIKTCPLLDGKCLKTGCEIYNERLDRCEIGLIAYNLYILADALKRQLEAKNRPNI